MADPDHTGERVGGKQGEIIAAMLFNLQLKADALNLGIVYFLIKPKISEVNWGKTLI